MNLNCKKWDLAVITKDGPNYGRQVFIIDITKPPHVHSSGLTSWYVEIHGEPISCKAPDGTVVSTSNCHIPDAWLKPVESFYCDEVSA
jgi:hypothetical protein